MLKNTAIKIASSKLASTSILPGSLILIGGIVVWDFWRKQAQLQTKTNELSDELEDVQEQIAEIKAESESAAPLSSSLKKILNFKLPWSTTK